MLTQTAILLFGLFLLYAGSALLVEGASSTALLFAVRPVIVGLTVVSFATSAPELLVSLVAAVKGSGGISIGNILGSNAINIALVLGVSAMISPVSIKKQIARIEIPYMIVVSGIFWMLCLDSEISRMDGMILIGLLVIFLVYSLVTAKENRPSGEPMPVRGKWIVFKYLLYISAGIVMLAYGANFLVREAIDIAEKIGLSQTFIGISVVALGTSLPELATSAVAASRGESDISVGNVVGSNLFNICLVMGTVGVFNPMEIDPHLHYFQFPFMLFICVVLSALCLKAGELSKKSGFFFITLFILYLIISYVK